MASDVLPLGVFNARTRAIVLEKLRAGMSRKGAMGAARCVRKTFYDWRDRGTRELDASVQAAESEGRPVDLEDLTPHARFWLDVIEAEAGFEELTVAKVVDSADSKDQRWLLERRMAGDWGPKVEVEHSGSVEVNVKDARNAFVRKLEGQLKRAGVALDDPEGGEGAGSEGGP